MKTTLLKVLRPAEVPALRRRPLDAATLAIAAGIVGDVEAGGEAALRRHAERFGDVAPGDPLVLGRDRLEGALASIAAADREVLERTAARIRVFAEAQRAAMREITVAVPGGRAGHHVVPVERAGCYAPGGRFPLPSSVLMTVVPARVAGVREIWVASPHPAPVTLAAAALAGADAVLAAGGAQAIAALAFGAGGVPACDIVVGPGNRWVTAAKQLVAGRAGIDMLAGPSELVVVGDDTSDAGTIAADLLAQGEHDPDALPVLVSPSARLIAAVEEELRAQLETLPTAEIARCALANGFAVLVSDLDAVPAVCNRLAAEHVQLSVRDPGALVARIDHAGALFLGPRAAEVLGDYGAGPNHVLPTGGTARSVAGLSVLTFLRVRTWLELECGDEIMVLAEDAAHLARLEGLEAHARAAERRMQR